MKKIKSILPPTYFLIILIFLIIFYFVFPIERFIFPPFNYLGSIFILFGLILNLWTDSLLKKNKTTVKPFILPTKLITKGPFKISRHPIYLGMSIILFGTAIICGTWIAFIFPIIFMILMEILFISREERNLINIFKDDYKKYKNKTRRWL